MDGIATTVPADQNGISVIQDNTRPSKNDNPTDTLLHKASNLGVSVTDEAFARYMDENDPLKHLRDDFFYPQNGDLPYVDTTLVRAEDPSVYFCGNSLGLEPKGVSACVQRELDKWALWGVHGHRMGEMPWAFCDECISPVMAEHIVGAKPDEVTMMNGLTVNLHLLMISFYNPTPTRYKVLMEDHAFPSDHYVVESQLKLRNVDPASAMVLLKPREGEQCLRTEGILQVIEDQGDSIAVVFLSGVQYYTGQLFDIKAITAAAQTKGCIAGWDLAHAAGNVELKLHDWGVDFAAWCSYKYLNSGAGGIAGFFVHEKNFEWLATQPRLVGWWSHKIATRFDMTNELQLDHGAAGFRVCNPPPLLCAPVEASLKVFQKTTMADLRHKSLLLTAYLELLLQRYATQHAKGMEEASKPFKIITPSNPEERGAQLSVLFALPVGRMFDELHKRGVVCDKREPDVLRFAPAPLYNNFTDIFRFMIVFDQSLKASKDIAKEWGVCYTY